ncbi:molybdopterin biosynthesis protein [Halobacteriaceae bacterium SHR40]|uniref:molybdopterin biosynthesis protein n=1 Tax=Halovenus amylolytica TaxID=2500550 RepID=UPI000FE2F31B
MRKEFRDLLDPEEAAALVRGLDIDGGTETVSLTEARGRILAERVDAAIDVPGFDRASVDGYAVRARDTFGAGEADPATLELAGTVHAGEEPTVTVDPETAVEISTGAVLPPGADAVVMVERTATEDEEVAVRTAVAPGDGIMVAGADVSAGERALGPGTRLTPREIALLSALGVEDVPVRQGPKVGIVSTGDELVRPGAALDSDSGQIFDVNSYTITTSVEEAGGEAVLYPHVGDDFDALESQLKGAAEECDLVLSSGSTSAGAVDVIYQIIEEQGELLCHGVGVKPGKPMLIGELGGAAYVGLPGYPVSALMTFRKFVAPVIQDAAGEPDTGATTLDGAMAVTERYREGRLRLMPVGVVKDGDGNTLVYPVDKGSGATTSLADADGIVEVPPDVEQLDAGDPVSVELFSEDIRPPSILGMGEDDPLLSRLLDRLDRPRYLPLGSREGVRRLREGIADVAVTAGPTDHEVETVELGNWSREWGLVVPSGNPENVSAVEDLVDGDLRFVNRDRQSGLRQSLEAALEETAESRGVAVTELFEQIDGFDLTTRGSESPPRRVLAGKADVALGLGTTATKLDLGFVSLGDQQVRVLAASDRTSKPGVQQLEGLLPPADELVSDLDGFEI